MASDSTPNLSGTPAGPPAVASGDSPLHRVFFGAKGLRPGWRMAIFFLVAATLVILLPSLAMLVSPLRPLLRSMQAHELKGTLTPLDGILGEILQVVPIIMAGAIMTLIDKRTFADYGLPWNRAFGRRFWEGVPLGFAMLSVLLASIWALHGFSLPGRALSGMVAVKYGLLWAVAFSMTGLGEDFAFRGYLQSAFQEAIGFWPAAIVLAVAFGAFHLSNPGERIFGVTMASCFGLVSAFSLWRTGNLWLSIGMHASWDWGQTYFYGVPDSGLVGTNHLFDASFHGKDWLTGGTVGPEGSWLVFPTLILWVLAIQFLIPAKRPTT